MYLLDCCSLTSLVNFRVSFLTPQLFNDARFLRMRDFDRSKSKEMFQNYLNWRKEFRVDQLPKVNEQL